MARQPDVQGHAEASSRKLRCAGRFWIFTETPTRRKVPRTGARTRTSSRSSKGSRSPCSARRSSPCSMSSGSSSAVICWEWTPSSSRPLLQHHELPGIGVIQRTASRVHLRTPRRGQEGRILSNSHRFHRSSARMEIRHRGSSRRTTSLRSRSLERNRSRKSRRSWLRASRPRLEGSFVLCSHEPVELHPGQEGAAQGEVAGGDRPRPLSTLRRSIHGLCRYVAVHRRERVSRQMLNAGRTCALISCRQSRFRICGAKSFRRDLSSRALRSRIRRRRSTICFLLWLVR